MSSTNGIARKKVKDLVGKRLNRLVVEELLGKGKFNKYYWRCKCDCGKEVVLNTSRLTGNSPTISCGCLRVETLLTNRQDRVIHGLWKHPLYRVYASMKARCLNPNSQRWKYYGARGVEVKWETVEDFYDWAINNGYEKGLSIDRIDNFGHYEPSNCRWITLAENTKRAHLGRTKKST